MINRKLFITLLALGWIGYHIYAVVHGAPEVFLFRSTHLLFALTLVFLVFPSRFSAASFNVSVDVLLIAVALAVVGFIYLNHDYVLRRFAYVSEIQPIEWVMALAALGVVLEGTRRVIGWNLPITAVLFLIYSLFFTDVETGLLVDQIYLTTEGIFGIALGVSATYMVMFIMFGAFVERMGTGHLFMDGATAAAGSATGGPAKVAVITSALFGTISGSPTANVMTTGAFTIPMMKRMGYRPAFAGAVEAVASTGGQILPPIMGAAAFVMVEFLGVGYDKVMSLAIIPAALFFIAVFAAVHFEAKRLGIAGMAKKDLPAFGKVMKARAHQIVPLVLIVVLLFSGYSAPYAAFWAALSVLPVTFLRKSTRHEVSPAKILEAVVATAKNTLTVAMACACAGIVIGLISLTGLTISFTELVVAASQDSLLLALILSALAGIVLAMGLPTTPAYILQVALLVPALVKLGVMMEAAHFFVLYFAVLSVITPPVAISLFAASTISGASVWGSGMAALRMAGSAYIIPFLFVYNPELLMIGEAFDILTALLPAILGVILLSAGLHGYFLRKSRHFESALLTIGALLLMAPGLTSDAAGILLVALITGIQSSSLSAKGAAKNP